MPGDYTLFWETWDEDWRLAELVLTEGEFAEVSSGDFRILTPEDTKLRGGSGGGLPWGVRSRLPPARATPCRWGC